MAMNTHATVGFISAGLALIGTGFTGSWRVGAVLGGLALVALPRWRASRPVPCSNSRLPSRPRVFSNDPLGDCSPRKEALQRRTNLVAWKEVLYDRS